MIRIEFTPTFKRIKEFADSYNEQHLNAKESNYNGTNHHARKELDPDSPLYAEKVV